MGSLTRKGVTKTNEDVHWFYDEDVQNMIEDAIMKQENEMAHLLAVWLSLSP